MQSAIFKKYIYTCISSVGLLYTCTYSRRIIMVPMDRKYWNGYIVVRIFVVHNRKPAYIKHRKKQESHHNELITLKSLMSYMLSQGYSCIPGCKAK